MRLQSQRPCHRISTGIRWFGLIAGCSALRSEKKMEDKHLEQDVAPAVPPLEMAETGLRRLALGWFTGTQAPLLLHDNKFPTWFQGFISRQETEEQLRAKPTGCFLIRLSERNIGYILSYKGQDRCRHFVIVRNKSGRFVISGDTETHSNLTDLIQHYKTTPIEPFGEYLTLSCLEACPAAVYDVVQLKGQQTTFLPKRPSVTDKYSTSSFPSVAPLSQVMPPVPKRSSPVKKHLQDQQVPEMPSGQVLYATLKHNNMKRTVPACVSSGAGGPPESLLCSSNRKAQSSPSACDIMYSELHFVNCKSRSLPILDGSYKQHLYSTGSSSNRVNNNSLHTNVSSLETLCSNIYPPNQHAVNNPKASGW